MKPTVQQIVKRLTAIEGQIGARQPVLVWLDPGDDAEQREAELRALGELRPGQRVHFVSWKTTPPAKGTETDPPS